MATHLLHFAAVPGNVRRGNSSVVEHNLAKVGVAGSNPVSRSSSRTGRGVQASSSLCCTGRRSQVAKAEVCKTSMQRFESARRLHIYCGERLQGPGWRNWETQRT